MPAPRTRRSRSGSAPTARRDDGRSAAVLRLDQRKLYLVDHASRTYAALDLRRTGNGWTAPAASSGPFGGADSWRFHARVEPTGETRKVGSWQAKRYRVVLTSEVAGDRTRLDWWTAPDLAIDDAPLRTLLRLLAAASVQCSRCGRRRRPRGPTNPRPAIAGWRSRSTESSIAGPRTSERAPRSMFPPSLGCRGSGCAAWSWQIGLRSHFADLRRGRCFAETERMMSFPRPLVGRGFLARAIAAATSASTSGRAKTSTDSMRMKRV
jgi:hypothetical protein